MKNPFGIRIPDDIKEMIKHNHADCVVAYSYDEGSKDKLLITFSAKLDVSEAVVLKGKHNHYEKYLFEWNTSIDVSLEQKFEALKKGLDSDGKFLVGAY